MTTTILPQIKCCEDVNAKIYFHYMKVEIVCYKCNKSTEFIIPKHIPSIQLNQYIEMRYKKLTNNKNKL